MMASQKHIKNDNNKNSQNLRRQKPSSTSLPVYRNISRYPTDVIHSIQDESHSLNPKDMLYLQRMIGNQAVGRLKVFQKLPNKISQDIIQKVDWDTVEHKRIRVEQAGGTFTAYYDGEKAGELDLYEDGDERQWINNISTEAQFQRRGIGLSLIDAAVKEYGAVYAATGMSNQDEVDDEDTRHLSVEGAALVTSAVRNGILKEEWCFNPAMGAFVDDYDDEEEMGVGIGGDQSDGKEAQEEAEAMNTSSEDVPLAEYSQHRIIQELAVGAITQQDVRVWLNANIELAERNNAFADILRAADRKKNF